MGNLGLFNENQGPICHRGGGVSTWRRRRWCPNLKWRGALLAASWREIRLCRYKSAFYLWRTLTGILVFPVICPNPFLMMPGLKENLFQSVSLISTAALPDFTSTLNAGKFVISKEIAFNSSDAHFADLPDIVGKGLAAGTPRKEGEKRNIYVRSINGFGFGFGKRIALRETIVTLLPTLVTTLLPTRSDSEIVKRAVKFRSPTNSCFGSKRNQTSAVIECTGCSIGSKFATLVLVSKSCFSSLRLSERSSSACFSNLAARSFANPATLKASPAWPVSLVFSRSAIRFALFSPQNSIARPNTIRNHPNFSILCFRCASRFGNFTKCSTPSMTHPIITTINPKLETNSQAFSQCSSKGVMRS